MPLLASPLSHSCEAQRYSQGEIVDCSVASLELAEHLGEGLERGDLLW